MAVNTALFLGSALILGAVANSQAPTFPRFAIEDMVYEGAFRVPSSKYGVSEMNFSEGPIAYNPENHSVFLVGHAHQQAVAEFRIPELSESTVLADLAMAEAPIQPFVAVLDKATDGNPQKLDRIGGLHVFEGPTGARLLVNAYEYYDAAADNSLTSLLVGDAADLAGSEPEGFFAFAGGAGHVSGWVSPIPAAWQEALGGKYLVGQSSGPPIISRWPVGPTAFAFSGEELTGSGTVPATVPTRRLLDFSLANPLHADLSNESKANGLWTHLTRAVFGMVVPGTRTYLTLGHSGGHRSGVCYKCTQTNGTLCGGYCAPDAADHDAFYWLWDVEDLARVAAGTLAAHAVRPYAHGPFALPFPGTKEVGGGTWDAVHGLLYLTLQRGDTGQGQYSNPPVIVAYRFAGASGSIWGGEGRRHGYKLSPQGPGFALRVAKGQRIVARLMDGRGRELERVHAGRVGADEPLFLEMRALAPSGAIRVLVIQGETFAAARLIAPR
jgi:hypothetical protein